MDFDKAFSLIEAESQKGEILIYVGIGCALGRYKSGEHPRQQYPPYLKDFACRHICVLIDPELENPPRALAEVGDNVLLLPIREMFYYDDFGFLQKLISLCMDPCLRVKMIAHDFTGTDINKYYPLTLGDSLYKNVLFDPTYGDGDCCPNMSAINILMDGQDFIQPKYIRLQDILERSVLLKEFKARQYPIVHLIARMFRVHCSLEEVRDWCTDEGIRAHVLRFSLIYKLAEKDYVQCLRKIVESAISDLCVISESYLSDSEIASIVESPGREFENMWRTVGAII